MLKSISDKNKFYLLPAVLLVLLFICYQLAFKGTFRTARNYRELKKRAAIAENLPQKIASLNQQREELNSKFFHATEDMDDTHEVLLERLGMLSDRYSVSIAEYPLKHSVVVSSVQIETHSAILQGGFINLLQVLYHLEVTDRVGRIVSVDFISETERKTKIKKLYMHLRIQNYRNLKDHENI